MAAYRHAMMLVAIVSIAALFVASCGGTTAKQAASSTSASQGSIDDLATRVQRDEMLNAWVTISAMPLHDLDVSVQGGKIDGKYVPTLRTLIRVLALTNWTGDLTQFTTKMRTDAVALYQALNAGKDPADVKDLSAAMHKDGDASSGVVGDVIAKDLPSDAGGSQAKTTPAAAATSAATP